LWKYATGIAIVTGCTGVKRVVQYFGSVSCVSWMWRLDLETEMVNECAIIWGLRSWIYIGLLLSSNLLPKCVLVNQLKLFGCLMWNAPLSLFHSREKLLLTFPQTFSTKTYRFHIGISDPKGLIPSEVEQR
jgi:hypothetical protein